MTATRTTRKARRVKKRGKMMDRVPLAEADAASAEKVEAAMYT